MGGAGSFKLYYNNPYIKQILKSSVTHKIFNTNRNFYILFK